MKVDSPTNETNIILRIEEELPKSTLYWFFISLVAAIFWTIYLTYYNSRVIGLIASFIVNKFVKYGRVNIGSFSVSVLSGKIMFRAVHFITEDFSVRIEYGWIIFKWWRPYVYKDVKEDLSHSETRLFCFIDGFEFHVYNRTGTYDTLEKLFGHHEDDTHSVEIQEAPSGEETETKKNGVMNKNGIQWRDLIPVCKFDVTTCRFVFGNNLVPNTLIVHLSDSHVTYTTTKASTVFDEFMHDLKVKTDSLRVMLVPSDHYTGGIVDEPPRMMGEGFVVMQSTDMKLHFYMDQPGLVPYEPEIVALADGETVVRQTYPTMGLDIQCGKNTDFNYGPWADRQREYLWKFFYPSSYQAQVPSKVPASGETRQYRTFEFRMNIVAQATIDILFTKYSVTQAIHVSMGQGSYVESSIPWVTEETGYTSLIKGQFLLLEATTSMQFRSLLECETLDFSVTAAYPLEWNDHQDWKYSFTACKATAFLIFQHKHFFADLIDDWSSKSVPDVYHFIPFTYSINLIINQFELVTLCNEYNWIDTSSQHPENAHIAFCGEIFDLSIQLPYTDFLPVTNSIGFIFKVENVGCRLYLPENNTSRHVIIAMSKNMKIVDRDGNILDKPFCYDTDDSKQWRRLTQRSAGWIDCWQTSNVALSITYKYHPMPPLLKTDVHHIMSPDDDLMSAQDPEEALLIPLRPMRPVSTPSKIPDNFDGGEMDSDLISVELEVAPSVVCVYGSLLRNFLHVKENYLGEDQQFIDFYDQPKGCPVEPKSTVGVEGPLTEKEVAEREFDERKYRPFAVNVSVTLHDIQGHLVKNCNMEDVPCPSIYVERLGFEMDKNYSETKLQVLLSPAVLIAKDNIQREANQAHLQEGHLALSGLQVRGHAMFSHKGLSLESETLEYAWLVEAIIGDITGKLTSPQIQNIVECLQTFIMLVEDPENSLQRPLTYQLCQHMTPQPLCKKLQPDYTIPCPSSEDIKYRMTRASVDCVNIFVVEGGTAMNLQLYPLRLSTCNLHGNNTRAGINCLIEHISLRQFISTSPMRHDSAASQPEVWLESGGFSLGPINAEAAMALPSQDFHSLQDRFLKLHDYKTERLWFLWPGDGVKISTSVLGKCGCLGGCVFFGNNRNGVSFFNPKKFRDVTPTAVCKVSPEGMDPGFGQSLLHKNKLVFEVGASGWLSPTREFAFTRGYMSSVTTPDTPLTSITVVEEINASPKHQPVESIEETVVEINPQTIHPQSPTEASVSETLSSSSAAMMSPCEVLSQGSNSTNPFDTVRSIDSVTMRESTRGSLAEARGSSVGNISLSSSQSPPPFSPTSRSAIVRSPSSKSSGQTQSGRSSVASQSPGILRRMRPASTRADTQRQISTVSLESEMYFSAEEDASSSSDIPVLGKMVAGSAEIHSSGSDSVQWGAKKKRDPNLKLDLEPGPSPVKEKITLERQDSSSSTNSTLSYMSVDTDPDETLSQGLLEEEFSMVDLHGQVNKPITKSPVLLPCYSGHLTRLQCSNWSTQSPFPAKYHGITVDRSSYQSLHSAAQSSRSLKSTFVPHFIKTKQGFSTRIMRAKEAMFAAMEKEAASSQMEDSTTSETVEGPMYENTSRTTATVKLKGSLDVLITPLLLESLQRFCEAVTPALSTLHPSAILDNLHFRCLDQLKVQNRLKKAEDNPDPDTPDSDEAPQDFEATQRQYNGDGRAYKTVEVKTSSYQALLTLSRINICMLQAGMVEEKISFSALDNISELTCVSLIGISIDNIRCQLLSNSHSCKTMKDVLPSVSPARNKTLPKEGKTDAGEIETDNVPEILREENVGTLHLNSVHLQLRRLLRDGHIPEEVILTAIPEHKSKVMFSFENDVTKLFSQKSPRTLKVKRSQSGREGVRTPSFSKDIAHDLEEKTLVQACIDEDNPFDAAPTPRLLRRRSKDSSEDPRRRLSSKYDERHSIGFIMFECGLEDISISTVRRLGYKEKSDVKFDKRMAEVHEEAETMEAATRTEVEGQGHSSDSQDPGQGQSSSQSQGHSRSQKTSDSSKPSITVGSQELYPSSNSVHSWDSRISIPSDASALRDEEPLKGDASSGTLHLKTVWFNFAAPPPLPIKRKADFTKKDWNLLSTATPAINAWLSPFDRLMTAVRTLVQELTHRTNSVMACIMTEGLEVQSIHMPLKSKYMRNTNFSKTLQEDASCQMLTVLRRYLDKFGTDLVEQAVMSDTIPQLITIQKGILALTRQWKNVLYMPQLSKFNFKSHRHRPYTVSFKIPRSEYEDDDLDDVDDEATSVNLDTVDEKASLIDGASVFEATSAHTINKPKSPSQGEISSMVSGSKLTQPKKRHSEPRLLQIQKALFDSPRKRETNPHMTSLLRHGSLQSLHSEGRSMTGNIISPTPPATPYKGNAADAIRQKVLRSKIEGNEDLYRWMAAQQEGFHTSHTTFDEDHAGGVRRQDSFYEAFGRGLSQEDSHTDINIDNYTMGTSIMQLADAQNLFKPFLLSIGLHVESVRPSAMMKKFGGNLSLQGRLDVLKIEIADSVKGKSKGKSRKRRDSKFVDTTHDTPAFLCQKFTLNISMMDVEDFEKKGSVDERLNKIPFKFAMHKLEAKPATLQVNFMVNCQSVTQHVDMPLLRLIHQFVTVIDNVNETRIELKQGHSSVDWIRTHRKQDSKSSSTSAETQQSDSSRAGTSFPKAGDSPILSKTNLVAESGKPVDILKPPRTHKPSISSFKFPFDSIKTDLTSTLKKSKEKFSKDSKKIRDQKSPGGYSQIMTPPQSLTFSDSVNIDMADTSSPAVAEKTIVDEIKETTPKCWRTLYHLLELYSTMPETKTVSHRPDRMQLPIIEEEVEKQEAGTPSDSIKTRLDLAVEEEVEIGGGSSSRYENTPLARSTFSRTRFKQSIYIGDSIPLVVFGIAKLEKVKILAVLSGLKLEGELRNVHASGTVKEKVKGFLQRKSSESSVTAHVGSTHIVLLEGSQTVVTVDIARSQGLHTTVRRRGKGHNSALVSVGAIEIDIPQHPVVLHGMLTRGTRQMSTTLQEFRRPFPRSRTELPEFGTLDSRSSGHEPQTSTLPRVPRSDSTKGTGIKEGGTIHIHLKAVLQGITIGASLLPSLKAQHKTGPITITGGTIKKVRFTLDLPSHTLSFKSKVATMDTSIPSSASIDLPPIHVYADYRQYRANAPVSEALTEGLMLKEGSYLNGVAEVGMFEHSLTTDLLNHLVFVQKVFMKEVNELLQKVSGSDKPTPIWSGTSVGHQLKSPSDQLLYSFHFRLKGIQITATTPTASAVRLETEAIDLEVSNRVQMASTEASPNIGYEDSQKVFIKAQVDLNVALGQLLKNPLFEEADPEFQTMAFFKTKIGVRNALQDEIIPGKFTVEEDGVSTKPEAFLINLTRPIVLAQPMAFDKAVLVWLNYKNAYEYWTEQRLALNKEVQTATQQVMDRLPQFPSSTQQAFSTLFLQLTVDDIGLCLPIQSVNTEMQGASRLGEEPGAAVVLTIESTQISACSSGSLVSKGKFTDFCLRIAEDFETSLDDWKPTPGDLPVMNACVVPEGTYEVCSRTIKAADTSSNAKWILNIKWEMQGIDVHLDTNIGKRLSALGSTLTTLAGEEDEEFYFGEEETDRHDVSLEDLSDIQPELLTRRVSVVTESLPKFVYDTTMDPKHRARLIEKEMNEQAKVVQDLKDLGASQNTIDSESRKLEELKSIIFHEFRREVLNRLKKQSEKASVIKDKLGIGSTPAHIRSKSTGGKHRESIQSDVLSVPTREGRSRGASDPSDIVTSKVQFGETTSTTYTPPLTPEGTPQHVPPGRDRKRAKSVFDPSSTGRQPGKSTPEDTLQHISSGKVCKRAKSEFEASSPGRQPILSSSTSSLESTSEHTSDETSGERVFQVDSDMGGGGSGTIVNEMVASSNPSIGSGSKSIQEPNIDFELVVKVFIDSGKCVLHPKDSKDDELRKKRDKTPTPESPPGRRKPKKSESGSLQGGQGKKQQQAPQPENTVFFLPGVDVKVHYNSKTDPIVSPSNTLTADASLMDSVNTTIAPETILQATDSATSFTQSQTSSLASVLKRQGVKKASLYAWLSLQPLPEETFVSPYLLDFLEQALEPIPISLMAQSKKDGPDQTVIDSVLNMDLNASSASIGSPALLGSFPVDVVVLIRVEPSVIRVNCLPTSRVECLLKIPSLELVFSTKRSDTEAWIQQGDGTPPLKAKFGKMKGRERNISGGRDNRSRSSSTATDAVTSSVSSGGLSVTACLSDFSLYIFHPYGGGQGKPGGQVSPAGRILGSIQEQSVLGDVTRKDSLSLKVDFIILNISRSRKLEVKSEGVSLMDKLDPVKSNIVRFSAICDIGSAAFKYDMRRLSEILSFPKSWYRRTLARRLFLGDESGLMDEEGDWSSISSNTSSLGGGDRLDVFSPSKPHTSNPTLHVHSLADPDLCAHGQGHHRRGSSGDKIKIQISPEFRNELADRHAINKMLKGSSAPQSPTDAIHGTPDSITMAGGSTPRPRFSRRNSHPPLPRHSSTRSGTDRKSVAWQTLVLYAVNLSRLDVHVNMSNVMGNTVWNTKDIKSHGRLSIDSSGHKNLKITFGLGGSHFDSKGGVVGGNVDLQEINTHFEVSEDPKLGKDPLHRAGLSLFALEGRVDYMGSSILMMRLSDMALTLRDEWKIDKVHDLDAPVATTRAALLFAHGNLGWDKFHILISRSTTPDLIKIASKLEEFIMQQFTSSKRYLGSMGPIPSSVRHKVHEKRKSGDEESFLSELRHHRHWQKALENITGCHFTMLPSMLPKEGMILGGNLNLHGQNLSLACFHGINFRSKAWALFTMNDIYISFATEAQKTPDQAIHVVQDLTFFVGHNQTHYMQGTSMAHVLKLSRGHMMPPTFTHVSEWFHYAFATSEVKDLDTFPTMRREGNESPSDYRKSRKYDYAHETEVIFALPPMQLHLVTKHNQAEHEPMEYDPKPVVECSFITEFEDHTLVAMDAEVILFLHDLIASYIREKDKGSRASTARTSTESAKSPQEADKKKMTDPLTVLQQDWREYQCITWQLEPTVRLLHWASKQIDPVGVDYVLQKLGFTHARVTIPKWMQRGFMDPSDKIISMLVNKLITVLRENPETKQQ